MIGGARENEGKGLELSTPNLVHKWQEISIHALRTKG